MAVVDEVLGQAGGRRKHVDRIEVRTAHFFSPFERAWYGESAARPG